MKRPALRRSVFALELPVVFLLAVAVRLFNLDHTPLYDELYHVLAARSWVAGDAFSIDDGAYTRGWLFTAVVGVFFYIFGESLPVARLTSLISGSLLVAVVFVWARRVFGRDVAWIAAALLALSPVSIFLSQYARFYAMHTLLFVTAAFCFHLLMTGEFRSGLSRSIAAAVIALLLSIALHLQITTMIGVAGLAAWLFVYLVYRSIEDRAGDQRRWRRGLFAYIAGGVLCAAALWLSGSVSWLLESLYSSPYWGRAEGGVNIRFYHYLLMEEYPALWALFPVAVILALTRKPAPAIFCLVVFFVALLVHSAAGAKAPRYFAYAMPFLFIIWACALSALYAFLRERLSGLTASEPERLKRIFPPTWQSGSAAVATLAFILFVTPAFPTAYRMMAWSDADWPEETYYRGAADWRAVAGALKDEIGAADVVLTTSGPMALYYLGRYDIEINVSNLLESGDGTEFSIDYRTGRPVISAPVSLAEVMNCNGSGLIVGETRRLFAAPRVVPTETAALIRESTDGIAVPTDSRMAAFVWRHSEGRATADCPSTSD